MTSVSRGIDRLTVTFDEPGLVANAGLLLVSTLVVRLGLEALINATVKLRGRIGGPDLAARCLRWCPRWWPAAATSTTPMCCGPGAPKRCSPTG